MANVNATTCLKPMAAASNGVFQQDNPMDFALPLLIVQICLILAVTRLLAILLKALRQPRVIAEIIGGILLGPSGLGHSVTYINYVFPKKSLTVLDTVAGLGLMFFLFFVGLELDLHAIKRTGRQALSIAAAGISVPFVAGVGVSLVLHRTIATDGNFAPFMVFMGVAMSITAFPVLARILAERKLLTTDVGQMAMSAAAVNDVVAWILLALAVALSGSGKSPLIALWVLLCGAGFVIVMFAVVKPMMAYIVKQTEENEPVNELHIALTLAGVLAAGFVTDAIGIHSIFGAFLFGLIIPKEGPFARVLVEKIEDFVTTLMLPLYFASSGLKTNIASIHGWQSIGFLVLVVSTACIGKIFGTFIVASLHKMNVKKSLTLGFLMNTKGLVELIVLNIGKDRKVLNDETFAIMVLMALFTTFITTPVVIALYKPARNRVPYRRRTIYVSGDNPDTELRVLACVHGMPNVVATLNLVEASRGTRKRPLHMYILHLLQLTERPSSIIKVQQVRENGLLSSEYHDNMDSVVLAFDTYGKLSKVTVQVLTAISNFNDMHEDICAIAGERRASIIIIPFHKHARRTDGVWEGNNLGLRSVNHKVLLHAPCSVGILVDRGLGIASLTSSHVDHNVAVLFFGGGDDREALAFGCRMAEHPGIKLTVFSFVHKRSKEDVPIDVVANGKGQAEVDLHSRSITRSSRLSMVQETYDFMVTLGLDTAEEFKQDKECMASLASSTSPSIVHEIREVSDPLEAAIEIGKLPTFSLLLVGRGRRPSSLIAPLSGTPAQLSELGPVGDALVSHSLNTQSSLLVVQQYEFSLVKEELLSSKADVSISKSQSCGFNSFLVATGPRDDSTIKESAHRLPV